MRKVGVECQTILKERLGSKPTPVNTLRTHTHLNLPHFYRKRKKDKSQPMVFTSGIGPIPEKISHPIVTWKYPLFGTIDSLLDICIPYC